MPSSAELALDEAPLQAITREIRQAKRTVLLASPFIGRGVAQYIATLVSARSEARQGLVLRALTSFTREALEAGFSSALGISSLLHAGFEIRAIPNLHAKLVVVDEWALVGSNNLTGSGVAGGNLELGLIQRRGAAAAVAGRFQTWWEEYTREEDALDEHDLARWVPRERRRVERDAHPLKGRRVQKRSDEGLVKFLRTQRQEAAIDALRAGLLASAEERRGAGVRKMPAHHSAAYRLCAELRHVDQEYIEEARPLLIDVLARHRAADARAHAAYRLGNDVTLKTRHRGKIRRALAAAAASDPATVVVRASGRALRQL